MNNRKANVDCVVLILDNALALIPKDQRPTGKNVRVLIEQVNGNTFFKSIFPGATKRVSSVAVPRTALSKDVVETLDGRKLQFYTTSRA